MTTDQTIWRISAAALVAACLLYGGAAAPQPVGDAAPGAEVATPEASRASVMAAAREPALEIVREAFQSEDPRARAAALEAIAPVADRAQTMVLLALEDDNPGVRFAALVTIGQQQMDGMAPAAMDLARDDNLSVRGAAVFAAQRCGGEVGRELSVLGQMLGSQDPTVRGNAAMLLGMLGDPGAIPMLEEMAATPMPRVDAAERIWLQLQFAEAVLKLNPDNEEMLEVLRSSSYSSIDDLRVLALRVVGEVGDQWMVRWMDAMIDGDDPIQVRIAAARSMAQMGHAAGRDLLIRGAAYSTEDVLADARGYLRARGGGGTREAQLMQQLLDDPDLRAEVAADIRAQSAFGLGDLNDLRSAQALVAMLDDSHPIVRLASAAAVLEAGSR